MSCGKVSKLKAVSIPLTATRVYNHLKFLLNMKRTFKALLLGGLVYVSAIMGTNVSAQNNPKASLGGIWEFERAEYMERSSTLQNYQIKHVIGDEYDGAVKCVMSEYRR